MSNHLVPVRPADLPRPGLLATVPWDLFDPTGLGPRPAVPLIPGAIRRRHHVFVETDTHFRQAARFLQHLWHVDRGLYGLQQ